MFKEILFDISQLSTLKTLAIEDLMRQNDIWPQRLDTDTIKVPFSALAFRLFSEGVKIGQQQEDEANSPEYLAACEETARMEANLHPWI